MRAKTTSLHAQDEFAIFANKAKEVVQQEQPTTTFSKQQPASDSSPQKNVTLFKGADNPYAAALADVFGLDA